MARHIDVDTDKTLWIVVNQWISDNPFKHKSEQDAYVEATRLAELNPGNKFFVLEIKGFVQVSGKVITKFDNLPF